MRQFTTEQLIALSAGQKPPCISLYQPTHRHHPDNRQDPIRFQNLLVKIERSLRLKFPAREIQMLLEPFQSLAHDDDFWNHRIDGLAILSSADTFRIFELQRTVPELLVVADSFHTKPLIRFLQSADRYQVLALNCHEAQLYEGNRYALDLVEFTNVPSTITEVLGEELTEQHMTVASYGAGAARPGGGATASIHAHGDKRDEVDIDRDRFFRAIDRGVLEHHSRPSGLPLVLAALTEYHTPFHKVSHNPYLMADGIMMNPDALNLDQLRVEAWRTVEPQYMERLSKLVDGYEQARANRLGSADLADVAQALVAGRVATLLVDADRQIPGKIDNESGRIDFDDLDHPAVDDLLDDLAELALKMGGDVVVVPGDQMPSETGVAATFRF